MAFKVASRVRGLSDEAFRDAFGIQTPFGYQGAGVSRGALMAGKILSRLRHRLDEECTTVYRADRGQNGKRRRGTESCRSRNLSTACLSRTNSAARLSCSCSM